MKRLITFLLILILCFGLGVTASAAEEEVHTTYLPANEAVRINPREWPSTQTVDDVTVTGMQVLPNTEWALCTYDVFYDVTVSVPEPYVLRKVTAEMSYFDSWPRVLTEGVSVSYNRKAETVTVEFPVGSDQRTLVLNGVSTNNGAPQTEGENSSPLSVYWFNVEYVIPHEHQKNEGAYHAAVAPTCSAAGTAEYWECSYPDCIAKLTSAGTVIEDLTVPVDPEAHSYGEYTADKEPTCTEPGQETAVCSLCGHTDTRPIPATGHSFGDYAVTQKPTCIETGVETATCSACGETTDREIPADPMAHVLGDFTPITPMVCAEDTVESAVCSLCGEEVTRVIPAIGHRLADITVNKAATCTECGSETGVCTTCGQTVTREIPIDPNAHNVNEFREYKAATCVSPNVEFGVCTRCGGQVFRSGTAVDPDGHKWIPLVGGRGYQCEYCHALKGNFPGLFGSVFSGGNAALVAAGAVVVIGAAVAAVIISKKKKKNSKQ